MESFHPEIDNFDKFIEHFETLEHVPYSFLNTKNTKDLDLEHLKLSTLRKSQNVYSEIIGHADYYGAPYDVFSNPEDNSKDIKRKIAEHARPGFDEFIEEFESTEGVSYELLDEHDQKSSAGTAQGLKSRLGRYLLLRELAPPVTNSIRMDIARKCDTPDVFMKKINIIGANILDDDLLDFTIEVMQKADSIGVYEDVFSTGPGRVFDIGADDDQGAEETIEIVIPDLAEEPATDEPELVHFGSADELQSLLGEE